MELSEHKPGRRPFPQPGEREVTAAVSKFHASGRLISQLPDEFVPIRYMVEPKYRHHAMNFRGAQ